MLILHRITRLIAALTLSSIAGCGFSTGISVRVLNADQLGADRVQIEALVDDKALLCGENPCLNVVPALEPRALLATEDVRVVLDTELAGKVVAIKVTALKAGGVLMVRTGMAAVEKDYTKIVVVDFAGPTGGS